MLSLAEIQKYYPEQLHSFKRFMLREYLQHKILQFVYQSPFAGKFAFLGGTCLRIVHRNSRFSEYLDFDNFGLTKADFELLANIIENELSKEGYSAEMKTVSEGAYHCYIRFPEILFREGLSGRLEEKILIQLDTEPQHFDFTTERFLLNRFDVFTQILITPKDLLLAQKFYTVLNRPRNKGRDFYDIVFLLGLTSRPNYDYLEMQLRVKNGQDLKERILERCSQIDMNEMGRDVAPFLFNSSDLIKVVLFPEYIKQVDLG